MPSRKRVVRQIYVHVGQGQKSWSGQENSNACGEQVRHAGVAEMLLDGKPRNFESDSGEAPQLRSREADNIDNHGRKYSTDYM